jgi:hypothetical protein
MAEKRKIRDMAKKRKIRASLAYKGMSRSQFGARYGVDATQVRTWANNGILAMEDDGSVNVVASDAIMQDYVPTGPRRNRPYEMDREIAGDQTEAGYPPPPEPLPAPSSSIAPPAPPLQAKPPKPPKSSKASPVESAPLPEAAPVVLTPNFSQAASRQEAAQNKDQADTLLKMLRYRKEAGELIERKEAEAVVFGFFRQERDAWRSWPDRVGTELAAMVEVDPRTMTIALRELVGQHLDDLANTEPPPLEQEL